MRANRSRVARVAIVALFAVTLLITLPSIALGFFSDDYLLRAELAGHVPMSPAAWDLYRFTGSGPAENIAMIAAGRLAWWASPEMRLHLIRPLASLLFALDARLFGAAPLGYHLVSIAWYLGLVAAVFALLRRLLSRGTATLASFIFAVDPAHVFPWGWPSCRHMTIAAAFAVLALLALVRARENEKSSRAAAWLAALLLAVGLAAGETALGGAAYAVAFAAVVARDEPWRRRAALVLPVVATALVYLVVYALVGGGAAHGGGYVSPLSEPGAFVVAASHRLPVMLVDATLGVPAELSSVIPAAPFVIVAALACAALLALYRAVRGGIPAEAHSALAWLVPGALLALVAALGGFPGARLRLLPDLGFAAFFAVLVRDGFARAAGRGGAALWARRLGVGFFAALHVAVAPLLVLANTHANAEIARKLEAVAAEVTAAASPGDRVFVVAASDPLVSLYPPAVLAATSAAWGRSCWSAASTAKATHRVTRTGAASLAVEPLDTTLLTGAFETLYRAAEEPMHVGDVVTQCGAHYRVAALRAGRPSRIELTFDTLDDPHLRLMIWDAGHLRSFSPPSLGASVDIAWSPGPIGFF